MWHTRYTTTLHVFKCRCTECNAEADHNNSLHTNHPLHISNLSLSTTNSKHRNRKWPEDWRLLGIRSQCWMVNSEDFDECVISIFKKHRTLLWVTDHEDGGGIIYRNAGNFTSWHTEDARRTQDFKSPIIAARIILKRRRNPTPDSPPG